MPNVSVVIPTYNCAKYLGNAIDSALGQNGCAVEVIVVDDTSTDDTTARFGSRTDIRYVRNSANLGPSGTRNRGVALTESKYVAFLDSDDAWLPGKLGVQIALLEREPHFVGASGHMIPWEDTTHWGEVPKTAAYDVWTQSEMVEKNPIATPTVVVRTAALLEAGGFDEGLRICEDYDLWLRLAAIGPFARFRVPMARYRTRPDGVSSGNRLSTERKHREYVESIPARFPTMPRVHRLVRKHLAYLDLDESFTAADELKSPRRAMLLTLRSLLRWPAPLVIQGRRFSRIRRLASLLRNCFRGPK